MSAAFVLALVEGFAGALDEAIGRVPDGELRGRLAGLSTHLAELRQFLETQCLGAGNESVDNRFVFEE